METEKYKKMLTPDFDIPDALEVTPPPSRSPARVGKGQRMGDIVVHGGVIIYKKGKGVFHVVRI
ncbi:MAG: hypothetical protein K5882_05825 [Bacteroidales bacterium]|nr:hypothetical protein [Bacteroidales bacterium]